eukprot:TRINITY_DN7637_c0_g1_i1.p1 TRINITY_DN7637_c0_g1~~TRINITY_DN7637_c0_g1_i1.p1  ORF type:complete len:248 (+),score=54.45 TRINITY_DN7637_c0_g1_i1:183-926(+)
MSVILYKWWAEGRRRRRFWVFFADLLKQGGGFFLAHVGNIIMSEVLTSDASPCVWYYINITLDCTARVLLAYGVLRVVEWGVDRWQLDPDGLLRFGEYGDSVEGETLLLRWRGVVDRVLRQCAVWWGIVVFTRIIMGLLVWALATPLADAGDWMLGPLERYTHSHGHDLELVVVMMLIPFALISFQLWVQDAFLQSAAGSFALRCCPCCRQSADSDDDEPAHSEATPIQATHRQSTECDYSHLNGDA